MTQTELQRQTAAILDVKARLLGRARQPTIHDMNRLMERVNIAKAEALEMEKEIVLLRSQLEQASETMRWQSKIISAIGFIGMRDSFGRSVMEIIGDALKPFPGVTFEDVISHRKGDGGELIRPRWVAYEAVHRSRPDLSYIDLGKIFDRDHTSIMYAVKTVKSRGWVE